MLQVRKGDTIILPFFNLHRDEKYFPNPNTFDPERFSEENKKNIKPFTYLPFGIGPRNCIGTFYFFLLGITSIDSPCVSITGSRFALMEIKAMFFNILQDFNIVPCKKTQIPIVLAKGSITMRPENGFWVKFERRK